MLVRTIVPDGVYLVIDGEQCNIHTLDGYSLSSSR